MNLLLCGLPGVGKSTVGGLLKQKLSRIYLDTDDEVMRLYQLQHKESLTCRQITLKHGIAAFRDWEKQVLIALKSQQNCLIATGGGIIEAPDNVKLMQEIGSIVYLKAPPELLLNRILKFGIPTYLDADQPEISFKQLAAKRSPIYEQIASFIVDTEGLNAEEIADKIESQIS